MPIGTEKSESVERLSKHINFDSVGDFMSKTPVRAERKTLILSLVAGFCGNAALAAMTSSYVVFSCFPIIAFLLAVYALYQEYLTKPMIDGAPAIATACFFVGVFGSSAFLRAEMPVIGSNYFPLMIMLVLLFWVVHKLGITKPKTVSDHQA